MASTKFETHKSTKAGRMVTLERRRQRRLKHRGTRLDVTSLTLEVQAGAR